MRSLSTNIPEFAAILRFGAIGLTALLAACTSGGPSDNPFLRKFEWRSYLAGDDLRRLCRAGNEERLRLVYNGRYRDQVRMYDIVAFQGRPAQFEARLRGSTNLMEIDFSDPMGLWRGEKTSKSLDGATWTTLRGEAIAALRDPPPPGLKLADGGYYWVVAGCLDGVFRINGFAWPSPRFEKLVFPDHLAELDGFKVALAAPRARDDVLVSPFDDTKRNVEAVYTIRDNALR